MIEVVKYDKTGKETGKISLNPEIFGVEVNQEAIKELLLLQLSNKRMANPRTKSRSRIRGGGKKPFKQKGTGRARQGSIRSPIWVGGAVAHGPDGRSYKKTMPKKIRRLALRSILSDKVAGNGLAVIEDLDFSVPKTKEAKQIADSIGGKKVLFIEPDRIGTLELSTRNLPNAKTLLYSNLNPHDLLNYSKVIILESALPKIQEVTL